MKSIHPYAMYNEFLAPLVIWTSLWELTPYWLWFHQIIILFMAIMYYSIKFSNVFPAPLNPDSSAWP